MPSKNLVGMPWRVALALQADGWILRNAIVWHKPNAMPESVRDRVSARYELLFLFVKQARYWFDLDAIRVPLAQPRTPDRGTTPLAEHTGVGKYSDVTAFVRRPSGAVRPTGQRHMATHPRGKNPGDVWSLPTRPLRAAHFATFPVDIPLRCIAAGCPPDGVVLDPFSGAATTGLAARQLGRSYLGVDLNPRFHDIAIPRMHAAMADPGPRHAGDAGDTTGEQGRRAA
jgi:site-specific DNA-methyltransferase (cytosine-N4-specific)